MRPDLKMKHREAAKKRVAEIQRGSSGSNGSLVLYQYY